MRPGLRTKLVLLVLAVAATFEHVRLINKSKADMHVGSITVVNTTVDPIVDLFNTMTLGLMFTIIRTVAPTLIDIQNMIKKTGTLTGKEFQARVLHDGPVPVARRPDNAIVAPEDFATSTPWRSADDPEGVG